MKQLMIKIKKKTINKLYSNKKIFHEVVHIFKQVSMVC